VVEKFWRKLEEQPEQILTKHFAEVHAVAQAKANPKLADK
jgi:hypothetical protein